MSKSSTSCPAPCASPSAGGRAGTGAARFLGSRARAIVRRAGAACSRGAERAALALIRAYQVLVSPVLGPHCRFAPSCSAYAAQAIARHGLPAGGWRAVRRLARCHPWHPGGYDPVD